MRYLIVGLLAVLMPTDGLAQQKPTAPARVVVSGKADLFVSAASVTVEIKLGEDAEKKLRDALKKVTALKVKLSDNANIVMVLPADAVRPDDLFKLVKKQALAAEGILTTTDNELLLVVTGTKKAGRVPILVVEKLVWLDEGNQKTFPEVGYVSIVGLIESRKLKVGTETFEQVVVNGDQEIPFTLARDIPSPITMGQHRLSGKARVSSGRLVVEVNRLEQVKK